MDEEASRWWNRAERDINTAEYNLEGKKYYMAVFLCEQAVEKAFKALWLEEKKEEIPRVHNLLFFFDKLDIPEDFRKVCEDLTGAYIETRYPTDIETPFSKPEVQAIFNKSKEILKWVEKKL